MPGFFVAQAAAEYGMVASIGAGLTRLRYEIDSFIGYNHSSYLLAGGLVLLVFLIFKRRR